MAYERIADWTTADLVEALEGQNRRSDRRHARSGDNYSTPSSPHLDIFSRTREPNNYPFNYVVAPRPKHLESDASSLLATSRASEYKSKGLRPQSSRSTRSRETPSTLPSNEKKVRYLDEFPSGKIKDDLETGIAPSPVHLVLDGHDPQDMTVHLNLPTTDDIGLELEEFSILRRLGNFKAAKAYFKERLGTHRRKPYVFVQYAQMLLDAGDYKALGRLRPEAVFGTDHLQGSGASQIQFDAYD